MKMHYVAVSSSKKISKRPLRRVVASVDPDFLAEYTVDDLYPESWERYVYKDGGTISDEDWERYDMDWDAFKAECRELTDDEKWERLEANGMGGYLTIDESFMDLYDETNSFDAASSIIDHAFGNMQVPQVWRHIGDWDDVIHAYRRWMQQRNLTYPHLPDDSDVIV